MKKKILIGNWHYDEPYTQIVEVDARPISLLGMNEFFIYRNVDGGWRICDNVTTCVMHSIGLMGSQKKIIEAATKKLIENNCTSIEILNKTRKKHFKRYPEFKKLLENSCDTKTK